ncbi:MAG: hypothetical protein ABI867_07015 [Kofleriaceae bacterium]
MDMELKFMLLPAAAPLLMVASVAPIILYIVARWRAHRDPAPDPQLGLKFVIYYFATIGLHLALVGGTLLLYTMIRPGGDDGDSKSQMYRMAFGFIVPAGVVLGAHIALLVRTNDNQFPGVKRLFYGFNLLITGLAGFTALVVGVQALFHKGSTDGLGHFGGAAILVYCTVWGLLAWRFDTIVIGPSQLGGMHGGPPMPGSFPAPPPPPPPSSQAASGGGSGLPPLGGGSFPPIDPPR